MSTAPYSQEALPFLVSVKAPALTVQPAAFWRRVVAWIADSVVQVVLWAISSALGFGIGLGGAMLSVDPENSQFFAGLSTVFLLVIGSWLYAACMESSEHQATYGKMLAGIRVTGLDGRRISFSQASARHFAKYLSVFAVMGGYLVALFSARKQAMHDMAAETLVVRG